MRIFINRIREEIVSLPRDDDGIEKRASEFHFARNLKIETKSYPLEKKIKQFLIKNCDISKKGCN